jgi:hypothetical protein
VLHTTNKQQTNDKQTPSGNIRASVKKRAKNRKFQQALGSRHKPCSVKEQMLEQFASK